MVKGSVSKFTEKKSTSNVHSRKMWDDNDWIFPLTSLFPFYAFFQPLPPPGLFDSARIAYDTKKLKLLFGAKAMIKGQRGTHPVGVGSEGIATIVSNPKFPACAFFTPGRSYSVCLRHSTIQSVDDVLIDFCGGSLRFAGSEDKESPCDIVMGTGPTTPLWSSKAIFDAVRAKISGDLKTYLLLSPDK